VWVCVGVCGCVGVWVCGCVGVWVCGCVWVCYHGCLGNMGCFISMACALAASSSASNSAIDEYFIDYLKYNSQQFMKILCW